MNAQSSRSHCIFTLTISQMQENGYITFMNILFIICIIFKLNFFILETVQLLNSIL